MEPTARDREIIRLARREVDPACAAEFAPITHGRVYAMWSLIGLGFMAVGYVLLQRVSALFRSSR